MKSCCATQTDLFYHTVTFITKPLPVQGQVFTCYLRQLLAKVQLTKLSTSRMMIWTLGTLKKAVCRQSMKSHDSVLIESKLQTRRTETSSEHTRKTSKLSKTVARCAGTPGNFFFLVERGEIRMKCIV